MYVALSILIVLVNYHARDVFTLLFDAGTNVAQDVIPTAIGNMTNVSRFIYHTVIDSGQLINIRLTFLCYKMRRNIRASSRHTIIIRNNSQNMLLYINLGADLEQLQSAFPSNFVHGIDAHIIMELYYRIAILNKELTKHKLITTKTNS